MTVEIGQRMPSTELRGVDGRTVRLRWALHGTVLVVGPVGAADGELVAALGRHADDLRRADARAVLVAAADAGELARDSAVPVVDDRDGGIARRLDLDGDDGPVAMVVDRYGEVWSVAAPVAPSGLDDLVDTARFVGVQCPECEVPDAPDERLTMEGVHRWK